MRRMPHGCGGRIACIRRGSEHTRRLAASHPLMPSPLRPLPRLCVHSGRHSYGHYVRTCSRANLEYVRHDCCCHCCCCCCCCVCGRGSATRWQPSPRAVRKPIQRSGGDEISCSRPWSFPSPFALHSPSAEQHNNKQQQVRTTGHTYEEQQQQGNTSLHHCSDDDPATTDTTGRRCDRGTETRRHDAPSALTSRRHPLPIDRQRLAERAHSQQSRVCMKKQLSNDDQVEQSIVRSCECV